MLYCKCFPFSFREVSFRTISDKSDEIETNIMFIDISPVLHSYLGGH